MVDVCCWPVADIGALGETSHLRKLAIYFGTPVACRRPGPLVDVKQSSDVIFSTISVASSTSMPRYITVLSIFECPSKSWTAQRLPVRW